jgi:SAM-dependent methyltransferase
MAQWFRDESFWRELYPFLFRPERFEGADGEIERVLVLTGKEGGAALDLCCGPGRHSVALAERGFRVTGVDATSFMLEKARRAAESGGVEVEFVLQDMSEFERTGAFDLAISLFTSFGYLPTVEDDVGVLRRVWASLRPGGALAMDVMGREVLALNFRETISTRLDDGTLVVQRHEIRDNWLTIRNEWLVIRGDEAKSFQFDLKIYSGRELEEMLRRIGFSEVRLCGDLEGNEYGVEAKRLVAIARKGD